MTNNDLSPFSRDNNTVALQSNGQASDTVLALADWASELDAAGRIASVLCQTEFVPKGLRGSVEAAAAAILTGRELGLSPMNALANIFVVRGRPAMYARTAVALVLSHGHEIERTSATEQTVTVRARRKGSQSWQTFEWSMERARKAGYTGNELYSKDPTAMLTAKAQMEACRTMFADVLSGMAATSVEEIELDDVPPVEPTQSGAAPASSPVKRTVKRKPRGKAPEPQAPDLPPVPAPEHEGENEAAEAEDTPVMSDRAQWVQAGQLMSDLGIEDKADKAREMREWATSQGITRDLPSMAALTSDECAAFTDYLQSLATGQLAGPEDPEDAS